jgi:cardiolipin synthase
MRVLDALVSQDFCRVADSQRSDGNRVHLLCDGPETFPAWLDAIAGAARAVHLENYILQEDRVGQQFADALLAAAGRGAAVRVIYDWMGCLPRTSSRFWQRLTDGGVHVRRYNPPRLRNPLGWISRDHRKVLCVDGRVAFTGGLCIGHDWMGDPARGIPPWRDTAIRIEGPAVAHIDAAFADSWASIGGGPGQGGPAMAVAGSPAAAGSVGVSVVAGRPHGGGLYRLEQLIAEVAERSLWLTDGYFVATTAYVRALADAARAGVDVRLLVPGSSNWPVVGALSKLAYRPLLEAGVRVFEWNGPMVHAKTAVADGCLTRIGSSNSNLASWISNRELDVTVVDDVLAGQMQAMYERDIASSTEVKLERGARTLAGTNRPPTDAAAGRLLSGAIGLGHTLGASLSQDRQLGSSDSAVLLGGGVLLLVTGLLAVLTPRLIAYPIGLAALWFAAGLLLHAWKLRRANRTANASET